MYTHTCVCVYIYIKNIYIYTHTHTYSLQTQMKRKLFEDLKNKAKQDFYLKTFSAKLISGDNERSEKAIEMNPRILY